MRWDDDFGLEEVGGGGAGDSDDVAGGVGEGDGGFGGEFAGADGAALVDVGDLGFVEGDEGERG